MEFNEIMEQHGEALGSMENIGQTVEGLQKALGDLGIDVLFNNREAQEFIPGSRLSKVVGERESYKKSLTEVQSQLEEMKKAATGNEALTKQLEVLEANNNRLLSELEETRIVGALKEAFGSGLAEGVSADDVLAFVNREAVKVQEDGKVTGAKEERERLEKSKPFLFSKQTNKGGSDKSGGGQGGKYSMNDIIRGGFGK